MSPDMPLQEAPHGTPKTVLWIVIVIFIAGVIGLSYYLYQNDDGNSPINLNTNTGINQNTNVSTAPSGWATYSDAAFGFSFQHPQDIQVRTNTVTGEIEYRAPNEWVPLFKPVDGSIQDAVAWLNGQPSVNVPYQETERTLTIAGTEAPIYSNGQYGNYAMAEFTNYTLVVHIVDYTFGDPTVFSNIVSSVIKG